MAFSSARLCVLSYGFRRAREAGVSTLGILLLVGISVTVAAAPMVMLKLDQGGKDLVVTGVQAKIAAGPGGWGDGDELIEVAHRSGRIMEAEFVEVVITVDGATTVVAGVRGSPDGGSFATPGAPWRHAMQIPAGAEVHVEVHWQKLMTEQLVSVDTLQASGTSGAGASGGSGGGGGEGQGEDAGTDEEATVTICHIPPGNPENAHTQEVQAGDVDGHLGHGDHLGACEGDEADGHAADQGHGDPGDEGDEDDRSGADGNDEGGEEEEEGHTICHIPPGNPDNAHTITVGSQKAVDAHLDHGDYLGACLDG